MPERGDRADAAGVQHVAGAQHRLPLRMSAPCRPMFCPACGRREHATLRRRRPRVSSTITTASAPAGIGAPVAISLHVPGVDGLRRHLAGEDLLDAAQRRRRVARGAGGVGGAHGVAVHGRARERRHVGGERRRRAPARGRWPRRAGPARCARSGAAAASMMRARLVERESSGRERAHRRAGRSVCSCCTTCPSSGRIRRVIARRTACFRAGQHEDRPCAPTVPAVARLIIAAGPISSKLSMRNSSPKPSRRFSSSASTASKVPSRDVMPVPPVVMMTRVSRVGQLLRRPTPSPAPARRGRWRGRRPRGRRLRAARGWRGRWYRSPACACR